MHRASKKSKLSKSYPNHSKTLYVGNIQFGNENNLLEDLIEYGRDKNSVVLPMCNQLEAEIAELDTEEAEFLEDLGLKEPG